MDNQMDNDKGGRFIYAVLFFGGLWGLIEASLGFLLHLIPFQTISGMILFPAGLFFMVRGMKVSGRVSAVPAIALVAATIKILSVGLPFVAFRFVRNPALAILTEGSLTWMVLGAGEGKADWKMPVKAVVLSIGWRSLFLALNIMFGLSGIASKPAALQRRFIFLDGGVDALIIIIAMLLYQAVVDRETKPVSKRRYIGPIPALTAVVAGIGVQFFVAGL